MMEESSDTKTPFLGQEMDEETGHSRSTASSGASPLVFNLRSKLVELRLSLADPKSKPVELRLSLADPRRELRPLAHRARAALSPYARYLKMAAVVLLVLMAILSFPSTRPYTSDLVVKTSQLRGDLVFEPKPPVVVNDTQPSSTHVMSCSPDMDRLREMRDRYKLDDRIEYLKRYVRFTRKPIERQSYTTLSENFLPKDGASEGGFRKLDLSSSEAAAHGEAKCGTPLDVTVPVSGYPADADLSDFMFAVSTTFDRLDGASMVEDWAYWLTDGDGRSNGGKLLLQLVDVTDDEIRDVGRRLAKVGIDAEVSGVDSRVVKDMAVRYLDLVPRLYAHESSATRKWLVLCDDDTFFPAAHGLADRFRRYDHTKPLYIGTLSEDAAMVWTHGPQAFGGGGIFISRPLARRVTEAHASCRTRRKVRRSNSGWGPQGDILLRLCIYDNTEVRLTQLHDLWQLDLSGDASGFYESGVGPLSLHHFRGSEEWHEALPLDATRTAHACGEGCAYQRFVTADGFVVSSGYSVAQYPRGIDFDLDQVERTFASIMHEKGWNFDYTFGPQRPSLAGTGSKVAWVLGHAERLDDGAVRQLYVLDKDDERWTTEGGTPLKARDGVIELVWIPAREDGEIPR